MPKETPITGKWENLQNIEPRPYDCGWCGHGVAPENGWKLNVGSNGLPPLIQICSFCRKPTLWDEGGLRYPAPRLGGDVQHLSHEIEALYDEARDCISVNAHTAVVLVCRTIISHVAVTKGAKKGDTFNRHIEYLSDNHHLPVGSASWVDVIRTKGGEAAHDLEISSAEESTQVLEFTEMLLKVAIEHPEAAELTGKVRIAPEETKEENGES